MENRSNDGGCAGSHSPSSTTSSTGLNAASTVSPGATPIRISAVSAAGTVDAHDPASTRPMQIGHRMGYSSYRGCLARSWRSTSRSANAPRIRSN